MRRRIETTNWDVEFIIFEHFCSFSIKDGWLQRRIAYHRTKPLMYISVLVIMASLKWSVWSQKIIIFTQALWMTKAVMTLVRNSIKLTFGEKFKIVAIFQWHHTRSNSALLFVLFLKILWLPSTNQPYWNYHIKCNCPQIFNQQSYRLIVDLFTAAMNMSLQLVLDESREQNSIRVQFYIRWTLQQCLTRNVRKRHHFWIVHRWFAAMWWMANQLLMEIQVYQKYCFSLNSRGGFFVVWCTLCNRAIS